LPTQVRFRLPCTAAAPTIHPMTPAPIIGRRLFVDGIVRPVFIDDGGAQYVIDRDGHTRCYGTWLLAGGADVPLVIQAAESSA
jgi:hypothetical protein